MSDFVDMKADVDAHLSLIEDSLTSFPLLRRPLVKGLPHEIEMG
jgi:hypothetical protein